LRKKNDLRDKQRGGDPGEEQPETDIDSVFDARKKYRKRFSNRGLSGDGSSPVAVRS